MFCVVFLFPIHSHIIFHSLSFIFSCHLPTSNPYPYSHPQISPTFHPTSPSRLFSLPHYLSNSLRVCVWFHMRTLNHYHLSPEERLTSIHCWLRSQHSDGYASHMHLLFASRTHTLSPSRTYTHTHTICLSLAQTIHTLRYIHTTKNSLITSSPYLFSFSSLLSQVHSRLINQSQYHHRCDSGGHDHGFSIVTATQSSHENTKY